MKKTAWIRISSRRYGGTIYGQRVREILAKDYNLEVRNITGGKFGWKYLKPLEWFFALFKIKGESDLWIRDDFYSIALQSLNKTKGKKLAIIYHVDSSVFPFLLKPFLFFLEKLFYSNLKKTDAIVTISEYWGNHFLEKGCKNVYKIYPAFNLSDFNISEKEILDFKKEFNLEAKPIVYIGNCQKAKGVVEVYKALKDLDVYLVTSGEPMVKTPALNLQLSYRDYLRLLKASSAVITMSKFKEGWCMTTQEAMLLKTPVIGSGKGGMKELLEGGKQIICGDFNLLREKVEYLLNNPERRKQMGESGYNFAKNFTLEKFENDWLNLIKNVIR